MLAGACVCSVYAVRTAPRCSTSRTHLSSRLLSDSTHLRTSRISPPSSLARSSSLFVGCDKPFIFMTPSVVEMEARMVSFQAPKPSSRLVRGRDVNKRRTCGMFSTGNVSDPTLRALQRSIGDCSCSSPCVGRRSSKKLHAVPSSHALARTVGIPALCVCDTVLQPCCVDWGHAAGPRSLSQRS